jgi:Spy/CpxP family protein refolding chaperone
MTENETDSTASAEPEPAPSRSRWRRRHRRRWLMFGLPIAAVAGLFAARAFAHGFRHGCGYDEDDEMSEDELRDRREHMVSFAARYLDATPQQKTRMQALAAEVTPQFVALRKEGKALRDKAQKAVRADDRATLETLRQQGVALADRGSQQWLAAYGKLSDILTPEQRAELAERLERRGHGRGRW